MKKLCWILAVGIIVLGLVGCKAKQESVKENQATKPEQETLTGPAQQAGQPGEAGNLFNLEEIENSGQIIEASYRWTVVNFDNAVRRIDLDEKDSTDLVMRLENFGGACEVGYVMLIDGIPQRYQMEEMEGYLLPVDCGEGVSEVTLHVAPTVPDTEKEHIVNFACIYTPSFRHSEEKQGSGYGNHHKMSQILPWKISGNFPKEEVKISTNVAYQPVSEAIKEKYITVDHYGIIDNQIEKYLHGVFYQNGTEVERVYKTEATQLVLFGGPECSYRVSVFVDNQPVPVFSGAGFTDVVMEDGQMAVIDLDFSAVSFSDYSCMYAILCPIGMAGDVTDPLMEKSYIVTLFR